jgi:hypothetical protein
MTIVDQPTKATSLQESDTSSLGFNARPDPQTNTEKISSTAVNQHEAANAEAPVVENDVPTLPKWSMGILNVPGVTNVPGTFDHQINCVQTL